MEKSNILLSLFLFIILYEDSTLLNTKATGRFCLFENQTFQECDVMFYTYWTICDGDNCPIGQQTRGKGICCPKPEINIGAGHTLIELCGKRCNLTDDDFQETVPRNLTTETEYKESETSSKTWIITGSVMGFLLLLALINLLAFFLYQRWKRNKEKSKISPVKNTSMQMALRH